MFIFAHIFLGALIGVVFSYLTDDRWAFPVCVIGALSPDLLDKTLAMTFPGLLGSGRTIGHSLLFFGIALSLGLLIWRCRHTLLGIAFACAVFSHQILDALWNLPATWLYPLLGPFPTFIISDYVGHYFWLEVSTPSEWIFAYASAVILVVWFTGRSEYRAPWLTSRTLKWGRLIGALMLCGMGLYLLYAVLATIPQPFFAPTYDPLTDSMAALIALGGAFIILKWPGLDPSHKKRKT
jgi:membrane-bound metal-dependent hydrolase YbcI (DUF457 family)